jgi:hypothetical protein
MIKHTRGPQPVNMASVCLFLTIVVDENINSFMLEINTYYTSNFLSHVEDYDHLPIIFKILIVDVA